MPLTARRVLIAVLFAILVSWAWFPLFQGGFRGDELRTLSEARDGSRSLFEVHGTDGHPLAAFALRAVSSAADVGSSTSAWPLRLEAALLVLLAAWMIGRFARRVLAPWCGGELARAAGWAASLVFALHPLSVASVASLSSHGDLLALPLGAACGWAYLRGRQEQHLPSLAAALVFAVLAGLSSDLALGLCGWLAGVEFSSARRHRKLHTRLRSAATTLAVAAACVGVDTLARSVAFGHFSPPRAFAEFALPDSGAGCAAAFATACERIGLLFVPINAHVVGAWGFTLAGFVALAGLQPILIAARSAPRLWGWMLLAWLIALGFAELCAPAASVTPYDMRAAGTLTSAVVVASVGLAVSITAMSGLRRVVLPLVIGLAYAALSHGNALAYRAAERELALLAPSIAAEHNAPNVLVVDAPDLVYGVTACRGAATWLASRDVFVRDISTAALCALAREDEFDALRAAGLVLIRRANAASEQWSSTRLSQPRPSSGARSASREGLLKDLDVEPATTRALLVRAAAGSDTTHAPFAAWRSSDAALPTSESGRLLGTWSVLGEAPEAVFDLSASIDWLSTPRVVQVWSAEGWSRVSVAQLQDDLQTPPVEPAPEVDASGAWSFAAPSEASLDGADLRRTWTLTLLDPRTFEFAELAAVRDGARLRFEGAAAQISAGKKRWALETRIDGRAVERLRGRLAD